MGGLTSGREKTPLRERNRIIGWCLEMVQTLFPVLLITYLSLILVETIIEGSVSSYINLNHLLIVVIAVGAAAVLSMPGREQRAMSEKPTAKSIVLMIFAGVGGAAIVWYKTQEIGWLSYVISVVSGGLIVLLSMLIWRGGQGEGDEGENSQGS